MLYGPRQRIWDQAENRRHAQKALLEWLVEIDVSGPGPPFGFGARTTSGRPALPCSSTARIAT